MKMRKIHDLQKLTTEKKTRQHHSQQHTIPIIIYKNYKKRLLKRPPSNGDCPVTTIDRMQEKVLYVYLS